MRLCLWSGPRNVSTALMYSFAQRAETRVVDEPLYAHYLRVSGVDHPGRDEVLATQDADGERVVREVILAPKEPALLVFKQMAHHLRELDWGFLDQTVNVLLVREPSEVLRSFAVNVDSPGLDDTGLAVQSALLRDLRERGQDPAVLDSRLLLEDPAGVLERLCAHLGLDWDPAMLHWEAGARPEDGVWAPHWYASVHASTGFAPYRPKAGALDDSLKPALAACQPHYDELLAAARRFCA